MWTEGISV